MQRRRALAVIALSAVLWTALQLAYGRNSYETGASCLRLDVMMPFENLH